MPSKPLSVIGLTGGIASGKSTVAGMCAARGAAVIDADQLARQVVEPGEAAYQQIVERFGKAILQPDQSINRAALGGIVFADSQALSDLEGITHPAIRQQMLRQISAHQTAASARFILLDIALLFEGGLQRYCDQTWLVVLTDTMQVLRLMTRNHLTKAQAEQRIALQMPQTKKKALANVWIDNNHGMVDLHKQVDELISTHILTPSCDKREY